MYSKTVSAAVAGGDSMKQVRVGLRVIPMGWLAAVDVAQAILRHVTFFTGPTIYTMQTGCFPSRLDATAVPAV